MQQVCEPAPKDQWMYEHESRTSPVAIHHQFGDATPQQKLAAAPLATMALTFLYKELVCHKLWNARFDRGGSNSVYVPPVRSLATRHLGSPAADGWNVVYGASELAHAWAFQATDLSETLDSEFELPRHTRIRLAVCLSVAWKFERQLATHFPRRFYDSQPSLLSPHTYELAYIGYAFMTDDERAAFGGWSEENIESIRTLYSDMVSMEVSLLTSTNVMTLLTDNAQVRAEARIQTLFDDEIVNADEAMAIRAIVPYFVVASQDGQSERPNAGALVCAAMLCVRVDAAHRQGRLEECEVVMRSLFIPSERKVARALIHHGRFLSTVPNAILALGCYNDNAWWNYEYVYYKTIERAEELAARVTVG